MATVVLPPQDRAEESASRDVLARGGASENKFDYIGEKNVFATGVRGSGAELLPEKVCGEKVESGHQVSL